MAFAAQSLLKVLREITFEIVYGSSAAACTFGAYTARLAPVLLAVLAREQPPPLSPLYAAFSTEATQFEPSSKHGNWLPFSGAVYSPGTAHAQLVIESAPAWTRT